MVLSGTDPEGDHPTTVVAAKRSDDTWLLHVPTGSRSVVLCPSAVTELAGALSPAGPAAVVIGLQDNTGRFTFLHAPIVRSSRTTLPIALVGALQHALTAVRNTHRVFGASKRLPAPRAIG